MKNLSGWHMTKLPERSFLLWIRDPWGWEETDVLRCSFLTRDLGGNLATEKNTGLESPWFCFSFLYNLVQVILHVLSLSVFIYQMERMIRK